MITEAFDEFTDAIITPEMIYETQKLCDTCIITFSHVIVSEILSHFPCDIAAEMKTANGPIPIYMLEYKGHKIAFYMSMIGSTCAAANLEEARCLIGAENYIMFGSCGCLCNDLTEGKLIVPTEAYRDEGLSYHYAKASDYLKIKNSNTVASFFDDTGIPYVKGKTWTTDAIFRETRGNLEKRKAEGCISVEMECAGIQAVCDFRGLEFYNFLISSDMLDCDEWERRILGCDEEHSHQLNSFYIALELALRIK